MIRKQKGEVKLVGIVVVIVVLVVVAIIIMIATNQSAPPPPSQQPGAENICFTYSLGLLEFQCGDNKFMGPSLGIWDCDDGIGAHECR